MQIRAARRGDLPRLIEIHNDYVEHTHITFDLEPKSLEPCQSWFDSFSKKGPHRLFVVESKGDLLGYSSSGPFRIKPAYVRSVETSIYLDADHCGAGSSVRFAAARELNP